MDLYSFLNQLSLINPFLILKGVVLILLGFYIVFAFIIVRQEHLMSQTIEAPISLVLHFLVNLHFLGAIFVFFLALLIL